MKPISRREYLRRIALAVLPLAWLAARARPARAAGARGSAHADASADPCGRLAGSTIDWIVPNAPGGGYDSYSRLIAPYLEKALAVEITLRNVPGAGGIVGARTLIEAAPDGKTIGIINASGLLAASLAGESSMPNPATAFTLLARIVGSRQIWATGKPSPHRTIDDVFVAARTRSIVFGTRDVGSLGFADMTLTSHLLGLPIEIVAGYEGSSAATLAAARGEVDLVAYNFDSVGGPIESGDIRPLLQIADARVSPHPSLDRIPLLGGVDGLAALRASVVGRSVEQQIADATTIGDLMNAGRLIVGPPAMPEDLSACIEAAVLKTLRDPEFGKLAERAHLSLDVADGAESRRILLSVAGRIDRFTPVIEEAIRKLRG